MLPPYPTKTMFSSSSTDLHEPPRVPSRRGSARADKDPQSAQAPLGNYPAGPGPAPPPIEAPDAALLQSVRMKMSSRDQEAMRRARWTMIEGSDTASSSLADGNLAPDFSTIPRRSNLAKQFSMTTMAESSAAARAAGIGGRSVSGPQASSSLAVPSAPPMPGTPNPPSYVIAVVGHDGAGKSTVIRRAVKTWGGGSQTTTIRTSKGHSLHSCFAEVKAGGKIPHDCQVEFVEVGIKALDVSRADSAWPCEMAPPSGVILCYDATRADTLRGLSEALHVLAPSLPMVMFACKSDPDTTLQVEAHVGDQIGQPYNIGLIEVTTASAQGKHKMRTGLRWLLYRLEEQRHSEPGAVLHTSTSPAQWRKGHAVRGGTSDTHSSSSSLGWIMGGESGATSTEGSMESAPTSSAPTIERELIEHTTAAVSAESDETFIALPDLINRLFTTIVSTESDRFVQTFFIIYRRFSQPRDLMLEFYERFVECEHYDVSRDIRLWALMKMAGALLYWANKYPGDFVDPVTQDLFRKTLGHMIKYTFISHITSDLARIEMQFGHEVDIDQSWSWRPTKSEAASLRTDAASLRTDDTAVDEVDAKGDTSVDTVTTEDTGKEIAPSSRTESFASISVDSESLTRRRGVDRMDSGSDISRSRNSNDDNGHRKWSGALQAILDMDPHIFALELTRMQWELFAAIRCRDILRHDFGRERDDPVGKSIAFFNRLSRFVSTMILAHPKPKGRAKAYEQFVKIAHRLRRLNNYDGLCAVIAGLRETSIHRLAQTHALVRLEPALNRDYQSHIRLMDPRGGYMHYRRALQADSTYGHHAIPLLTTVLSLVNRLHAARPQDRRPDGTVAWDKFSRFGAMMSVIPEFQARGCNVAGVVNAQFRRLLEVTPVIASEDGLYERSKVVESGGPSGGIMRKLANLGIQQR